MRCILPILLSLFLIVGSGCGRKSGPTQSGQIELEVAVFQGGYGLDFFQDKAREYEKLHPNVKVKVWGNPRIWEPLRPRFASGNPPDLTWPGWDMDYWGLVAEGQVMEMDDFLKQKAYDQDKPWGETFIKELLDKGRSRGHYYILPFNFNIFGWWYNVDMFERNGWKPPKTYPELLALCERMKRKGIAPITFQGRYPAYMITGMFLPWAISVGGLDLYERAQRLDVLAWKDPAFLRAAEMIAELRKRGYFQEGATGMSHTDSQMEFLLGRAAMIPCGTWLHSEMKNKIPKGFKMDFFLAPIVPGGKGDPSLVSTGTEDWIVPKRARHVKEAADFFRFMTSLKNAREFVVRKNTLMAIKGSDDVSLPPYLVTPAKLLRRAKGTWSVQYRDWYPTFGKEVEGAIAALASGDIDPKECMRRIVSEAQKAAGDKSLRARVPVQ